MTYKPAGRGGGGWVTAECAGGHGGGNRVEDAHARWRRAEQGRKEDSGRRPVPTLVDAGESIRGERLAMGAEGRKGRGGGRGVQSLGTYGGSRGGCNTCTWHGQCVRYPTNARKPPRHSPSNPVSRTHPNFPITTPVHERSPPPSRSRTRARARCPPFRPCVSFCRQMRAIRRC